MFGINCEVKDSKAAKIVAAVLGSLGVPLHKVTPYKAVRRHTKKRLCGTLNSTHWFTWNVNGFLRHQTTNSQST